MSLKSKNIINERKYHTGDHVHCVLCNKITNGYADYYSKRGANAVCLDCADTLTEMFHVKRSDLVDCIQGKQKMTPMSQARISCEEELTKTLSELTPLSFTAKITYGHLTLLNQLVDITNHNTTVNKVIRAFKLLQSIIKSDQYDSDYKEEMYKTLDKRL